MAHVPSVDVLLNLVPDRPNVVVEKLHAHPDLAPKQDAHGYSLVHAAASYGHADLLQALIQDFHVDPNIRDEDGETALFSVDGDSAVRIAAQLLSLGTDRHLRNHQGQTAAEKLDDDDEQPAVAAFLRQQPATDPHLPPPHDPAIPPPPHGLRLNMHTMLPADAGEPPDPEFRRRIEQLAASGEFETERGQRELRDLVADALSGVAADAHATTPPPATRRRVG